MRYLIDHLGVARLDVDVAGAPLDGVEQRRVDQLDDRALVRGDAVEREDFAPLLVLLHELHAEVLGRLVEDALHALGLLQDLLDGAARPDLEHHLATEQHLELVDLHHVGGVGEDDRQAAVGLALRG